MKIFILLFSLYFAALSLKPCNDRFDTDQENRQEMVSLVNIDQIDSEEDLCSPICSCLCCRTINIIEHFPAYHDVKLTDSPAEIEDYSLSYLYNFYGIIWQPPKLG